ncbi:MAG: response regulator [Fimbriimonas sp.]|nr:response regulator [Fimbriimonas sp.]
MARILLVDDEVEFRTLLRSLLVAEGHEVECASNGVEALETLHCSIFDLVITDLIMPEKEGIEMMMELRKESPKLKIIAMTGGGFGSANDYLSFAKALGAVKTLAKPFTRDEILAAVSGSFENG